MPRREGSLPDRDSSKHGGGSSLGDSKTGRARAGSIREFSMDAAAMEAMNRELVRAQTQALTTEDPGKKKNGKASPAPPGGPVSAMSKGDKAEGKPRKAAIVNIDAGSEGGGSQAASMVRSQRSGRKRRGGDGQSDGGSERRSASDWRSGQDRSERRDGSVHDSSAPSKSIGLVEVLAETDGYLSRMCIIIAWVPVVLLHGQTLLQLQSFFSLFYLVSIPLELAFSVGSIPCLSPENWLNGSAANLTNGTGPLCDPANPDGDLVDDAPHRDDAPSCVG